MRNVLTQEGSAKIILPIHREGRERKAVVSREQFKDVCCLVPRDNICWVRRAEMYHFSHMAFGSKCSYFSEPENESGLGERKKERIGLFQTATQKIK